MSKCDYCGKQCNLPFHCSYCGGSYCSDHRLPPSHNCINEAGWRNQTSGFKSDVNTGGNSSLPLKECFFCGLNTSKIFYCPLCGREFCSIHKLHQDHLAPSKILHEKELEMRACSIFLNKLSSDSRSTLEYCIELRKD